MSGPSWISKYCSWQFRILMNSISTVNLHWSSGLLWKYHQQSSGSSILFMLRLLKYLTSSKVSCEINCDRGVPHLWIGLGLGAKQAKAQVQCKASKSAIMSLRLFDTNGKKCSCFSLTRHPMARLILCWDNLRHQRPPFSLGKNSQDEKKCYFYSRFCGFSFRYEKQQFMCLD